MKDFLYFFKQNQSDNNINNSSSSSSSSSVASSSSSNSFNKNIWIKLLETQWVRIVLFLCCILLFIGIWNIIGDRVTIIIFTILPLFIGFGFSYLLDPVNEFFQRFFSKKLSKIIVFISFLIITLLICAGLFVLFFIQLNNLYQKLFDKTEVKQFSDLLKVKDATKINDLKLLWKGNSQFSLSYSLIENNGVNNVSYQFHKDDLAGIYILILQVWSKIPIFKSICFSIMHWFDDNLSNYNYLNSLLDNWKIFVFGLYFFFFTIIIAAFSLGKGKAFFKTIWVFLTKNQKKEVAKKLEVQLKKNLASWGKGLLIVEIYILIGTGLIIFTTGLIFNSFSSYLHLSILLALFMAVLNLIPYIGPTIGFIPIIGIGLIDAINNNANYLISWAPFIIVVLGCFLIQVGETVFVSPLVYSYQVKLNPILIVISLALCTVVFGYILTPFTIPTVLIVKIIYNVFNEKENIDEQNKLSHKKNLNHRRIN